MQAFYQIFRDLAQYVKQYFPNGIPWNAKGLPVQEVVKALASTPSAPPPPPGGAGGPPPPPPPGPPPVLQIKDQKAAPAPAGGLGAVFSELNKGESVTKGLRKVDKSEMTHKNPSLRAASTVSDRDGSVPGKSPPVPGKKPKPESMRVKKPPKKELDGNKWMIVSLFFSRLLPLHSSKQHVANNRTGELREGLYADHDRCGNLPLDPHQQVQPRNGHRQGQGQRHNH